MLVLSSGLYKQSNVDKMNIQIIHLHNNLKEIFNERKGVTDVYENSSLK